MLFVNRWPYRHRVRSRLRSVKLAIIGWTLPLIFVSCHIGSFDLRNMCLVLPTSSIPIHFKLCIWRRWVNISIVSVVSCQFWLAFTGNCTMYVAIVNKLNKQYREMQSTRAKERNHVAKMLIINACVFFICMIPLQIYNVFLIFDMFVDFEILKLLPSSFIWVGTVTALINSAVNPLIYGVTNPSYRKAFKEAFSIFSWLCIRR